MIITDIILLKNHLLLTFCICTHTKINLPLIKEFVVLDDASTLHVYACINKLNDFKRITDKTFSAHLRVQMKHFL